MRESRRKAVKPSRSEVKPDEKMRFEALLRASTDSIFLLDDEGTILSLNEAAAVGLGRSMEKLRGSNLLSYTYPEAYEARRRNMKEAIRTGRPIQFEETRKGSRYEIKIHPVLGSQKTSASTYTKNVTEIWWMEKRIKQQSEILEDLYENAAMMYLSADVGGTILKTNKLMVETLGYTKEELIGTNLTSLLASNTPETPLDLLKLAKDRVPEREFELSKRDGAIIDVIGEISIEKEEGEEPRCASFVLYDVSEKKRLEKILKESESRYRELVENSPNPISVTVGDKIVYANAKRAELSGLSDPNLLIGTETDLQIFEADKGLILSRREARARGLKPESSFTYRMVTADGRVINVVDYTSEITFNDEKAVQHMIIDVTQLRHYEASIEALLGHSLEMAEAESLDDVAGMTLSTIQRVLGHKLCSFGVAQGDVLRFLYIGDAIGVSELPLNGRGVTVRAVNTGKTQLIQDVRADCDYVAGGSNFVTLSELVAPIKVEGKTIAIVNVESERPHAYSDQDKRLLEIIAEQAASRLKQLSLVEKGRIAERKAGEEAEKTRQANRLAEMKSEFIRTATHEIKTPLTSIRGYSDLILSQFRGDMHPDMSTYFDAIIRNTDRLQRLTDDLLDVQRIESGRLSIMRESIHIGALLDMVRVEMSPLLVRRGQRLSVDAAEATVFADPTRLMQVLVNLVSNASHFSKDGDTIRIRVSEAGGDVVFSVSDDGKGIREEDMGKLFKPFPDIHVEGVTGGTGLGLNICKGIVELHGGCIWAESGGRDRGTTLSFTIPGMNKA